MSRERDIERVLEAWLRPGPTVMPDRLFDDVLARIERQPQRRLARVQLRITAMRPVTLLAAAAAIAVAVGVGVVLLGRPATPDVGAPTPAPSVVTAPSASPAATPSESPAAGLPAELRYRWIGAPRPIPALSGTSDVLPLLWMADPVIWLNGDLAGRYYDSEVSLFDTPYAMPGPSGPVSGALELAAASGTGCSAGDVGQYDWSLSADRLSLTLAATHDDCADRAAAFSGTWTRSACQNPDDTCLGTVPAGTYHSTFLDVRSAPADVKYSGAYDQLRYSVPDGWANQDDWPHLYSLVPAADHAALYLHGDVHGIYVFARPAAWDTPDDCSVRLADGVGTSPGELGAWITTRPGLLVTNVKGMGATPARIGAYSGVMLDVAVDPSWTTTCPGDESPSVGLLAGASGAAGAYTVGIGTDEKMRLVLLDVGGGTTVAIAIDSDLVPSRFDELVAQAMPIVETFTFPE